MFRRLIIAVLALAAVAAAQAPKKVSAPQTARQALIEMLTTKSDTVFASHLPEALNTRLESFKSKDAKTGKESTPVRTSNESIVDSKDAHLFPTGATFLVYTSPKMPNQKLEMVVDRDEPAGADAENFEFSFHFSDAGKESMRALTPKLLVQMKQEDGTWRMANVGFSAILQLDDGEKLDELMTSAMGAVAAMQPGKPAPDTDKPAKPAPHHKPQK
jgi:hypothetical protein